MDRKNQGKIRENLTTEFPGLTNTGLNSLLNSAQIILLELDPQLNVTNVHGPVQEFLGITDKHVVNTPLNVFLNANTNLVEWFHSSNPTDNLEVEIITKSGVISRGVMERIQSFDNFIISVRKLESLSSKYGSEAKLNALFESALDSVITIDDRGTIETLNPITTQLFGYTQEEMVGKNISMLMPDPDSSRHDSYIANYIRTGQKKIIGIGREVIAKKKDGSLFPIKLSITEIYLGEKRTFMGMVHDLTTQKVAEKKIKDYSIELEKVVEERTEELIHINKELEKEIRERKIVEEALLEGQKLYREIARNFPDGTISVLDSDLNYVFIDGKELFELGLSSESLIGTNIKDRLPNKLAFKLPGILKKVFQNRKETIEIEINQQAYMVTAVPLTDLENNVKQILVVEENITNQKKAEKNIKAALKKEMDLNSLKSRFVSMASHEFRTPLSTVLSSVTLIEKYLGSSPSDNIIKHVVRIKGAVNNLTAILNDMLSLSKLEEGIIAIHPKKINIENLCIELQEEMQQQSKFGQVILYLHKGTTNEVLLDPHILKNILHNLISNAIKYSPENSEIYFETQVSKQAINLIVRDKGIGIPKEDQEYMFQRFFRARNVTNSEGTGLGLSILKRYVELMNGKVTFTSEENQGTTFEVKLNNQKE